MRKVLITSNVLLMGIIFFMSCNKSDVSSGNDSESTSKNVVTGKTTARSCPDCFNYTGVNFQGVNAATAAMMSHNYKTLNQPLLEIAEGVDDANSIWFSLQSLKTFIWQIEEAACKNGCPNAMKLGLRVYYGRYPENMGGNLSELDPNFAQHHTLFLVPTFQDELNPQVHWDFDPWHWGRPGCKPITMKEWFSTSDKPFDENNSLIFSIGEDQYFMNTNGTLSSAMNHGDLIPPYPSIGPAY